MSEELKMKKVFNKGKRSILCVGGIKLMPGKNIDLSLDEAQRLIKLFPEEVIELDNIKVIDKNRETQEALDKALVQVDALSKEVAALKESGAKVGEELKAAKSKIVALEAELKKAKK